MDGDREKNKRRGRSDKAEDVRRWKMKRRIFLVSRETTTREKARVTCYLGSTHDRHRRWSILLLPIVCDAKWGCKSCQSKMDFFSSFADLLHSVWSVWRITCVHSLHVFCF